MRKYGKWLLVLGILAANPAWAGAEGIPGLRQVLPPARSVQKQHNQQQAQKVAEALKQARINGYDLSVEVRGETAKLDGKVRDVTHRARAEQAVRRVPGVTQVVNNLRYVPEGQVQQTAGRMTDGALRPASYSEVEGGSRDIQRIHFQKPGRQAQPAQSAQPQRAAQPQTRTLPAPPALDYQTDFAQESQASELIVHKTAAQQPAGRSNQAVAQDIASSLAGVGLVGYDVEIRYEDGIATLAGDVSTVQQMQEAGRAASEIPGVQDVRNNLKVKGPIAQTAYGAGPRPQGQVRPASMMAPAGMAPAMMGAPMGAPNAPMAMGGAGNYSNPNLPSHAWPSYAAYPNSAAVSYPKQYSASAWPYIGPFYPYPQVPLGWREVSLQWDDGHWQLDFEKKKSAWYWLWQPKNWHSD